jgi:hypothetical protein
MEEIMNKVLGMDVDTRRRTVEAVVLYIFTVFATFNLPVPGEDWQSIIIKLLTCLVEAFILFYEAHYKNNDHTPIAAEHTGAMRQEKAEQDPDYEGERFYTEEEGEDIDEFEDEEVEVEEVEADE